MPGYVDGFLGIALGAAEGPARTTQSGILVRESRDDFKNGMLNFKWESVMATRTVW